MSTVAERVKSVKKFSEWKKCPLCLYPDNFEIEVVQDNGKYFYTDKCPRCKHHDEFKEISKREASKYLLLDDLA